MGKTGQPAWAKRILKLLEQAKAKGPDFERFGADSHQYQLAAPASEEQILKFEEQQGIRLPEEYRDFLLHVGNGGAGPYYGLDGIRDLGDDLHDSHGARIYRVQEEPVIYPKMSDEEWNRMTAPESRQGDSMGKGGEVHPYVGVLPIGSQGCTLMTGLMLAGPYQGQVVYYDEDYCGPPFFVREKGFLSWYERWLREVIAGYSDEETGFGMNIDGNPAQLMELYEQAQDPEEKIEIIDSYYKFETLPGKQKTYFKQACARESDMEVRMKLIKMMARFHVPGMAKELETLWEYGAYAEAVSIITHEGTWEVKEAWYEKVFEILPKLHGEGFRDACHTISAMKEYPNEAPLNLETLEEAVRQCPKLQTISLEAVPFDDRYYSRKEQYRFRWEEIPGSRIQIERADGGYVFYIQKNGQQRKIPLNPLSKGCRDFEKTLELTGVLQRQNLWKMGRRFPS